MNRLKKTLSLIPLAIVSFSMVGCISTSNSQSKGLASSDTLKSNSDFSSKGNSNFVSKSNKQVKKQALLLGISDYAGESNDLGGIERDIEKMKNLFTAWGFDVKILYDKDSMNILNYLDSYSNNLGNNDYFAFYYSGHGSHISDKNGDESDGEDESLVLSDGKENKHLIDDVLYAKFNAIKAKKMIFFDSCHSGTVFRALNGKFQSKTISPDAVNKSFSKGLSSTAKSDNMNSDSEYVVLSSSRDSEESLATPTGSLFTNSLNEIFSDKSSYNKSFEEINKILTNKILTYAKESDGKAHHPSISFSKSYSNSNTFKDFMEKKSTQGTVASSVVKLPTTSTASLKEKDKTLQDTLDNLINSGEINKMSLDYKKTSYKSGESIKFELDTKGETGYLTLFYIDSNDVTLLYPNPFVSVKKIEGKYTFPDDFSNGKFELEAYKSCSDCKEEKTVIYTLLSSKPILDATVIKSKDALSSFAKGSNQSKVITRAVRIKTKKSINERFNPQLNNYSFIVK